MYHLRIKTVRQLNEEYASQNIGAITEDSHQETIESTPKRRSEEETIYHNANEGIKFASTAN